jgi:hypothetical protein
MAKPPPGAGEGMLGDIKSSCFAGDCFNCPKRTGIRRFLLMVEGAGAPGYALETIGRLGAEVGPLVS